MVDRNVSALLRQAASRDPDAEALADRGKRFTYAEFELAVSRVAAGFAQLGVVKGSRVAILAENSANQLITYLAVNRLGAVAVMLNFRFGIRELAALIELTEPAIVAWDLTDPHLMTQVGEMARRRFESTTWVSLSDGQASIVLTGPSWGEVSSADALHHEPEVEDTDASVMMCTSGTSGMPKMVVLTREAEWLNTMMCLAAVPVSGDDVNLNVSPLFHAGPLECSFLPHLAIGAKNVIARKLNPSTLSSIIEEEGITTSLLVPTHVSLLRSSDSSESLKRKLKNLVLTGSRIGHDAVAWLRRNLADNVWNMYGLTEAGALISVCAPSEFERPFQAPPIGRPIPGMEVEIVDVNSPTQRRPVEHGQMGQLIVRGPKLMREYYSNPTKSSETIRDGWLYTGDVGFRDDHGILHIVDRSDDMIITGGENVYPVEVETVLMRHRDVVEAAVTGHHSDRWGQEIVAYVVSRRQDLSPDGLAAWLLEDGLARFKVPKRFLFIDELPRNPSGKLMKRQLPSPNGSEAQSGTY